MLLGTPDDVIADAVLIRQHRARRKAVPRGPLTFGDTLPERVGYAEIGRLLRHMANLVH
ncbi:hypothetical protein GCM10022245_57550 [Streptomyces mayteni]